MKRLWGQSTVNRFFTSLSAHAVDREFRVMRALQNIDVPVAKTYLLRDDDTIIGSMFYFVEYIDGRVFWDPALPDSNNTERSAIYDEMNPVLAALHSIDVKACWLEDYGRPGNYYERQISRWIKQYKARETHTIKEMDLLIDWLPKNKPEDDGRVSLVHGDFRLDNMMFANDQPKVLALVDWELSTLY